MAKISVVIPVYNEEQTLPQLFTRLDLLVSSVGSDHQLEFLLINDGSIDRSLDIIKEKVRIESRYKLISFSRNFGHQSALLAGITLAEGDAVIAMDADLQDPPEVIVELIASWELGSDVVYAERRLRNGESFFKRFSASIFYGLIDWLSETDLPRNVGDFRLMDRRVVDVLLQLPEKSLYLRGLVAWVGFKQTAVLYDRDARFAGETKYSMKKMLNLATDALLSFSEKPLRIVTRLGFAVTTVAFFLLGFFLITAYLTADNQVHGWLSMIFAILFLGGIQLICLGIVGEYVSRIYREVKGRPLYIIDERKSLL
jgi:glycosyltransferase involved in cell wall biosynthesis